MRCLLAGALMLTGTAFASGQTPQEPWVSGLGGEIRVTSQSGQKSVGHFLGIDADAIRLMVADQEILVRKDAIAKLERRGDSLWNGFAFGAIVGLLPAAAATSEISAGGGEFVAITTIAVGIYGLIGLGIDALFKGWTTVYKGEPPPKTARHRGFWVTPTSRGMRVGYSRRF